MSYDIQPPFAFASTVLHHKGLSFVMSYVFLLLESQTLQLPDYVSLASKDGERKSQKIVLKISQLPLLLSNCHYRHLYIMSHHICITTRQKRT